MKDKKNGLTRFLGKLGGIVGIIIFSILIIGIVMGIYFVGFAELFQLLGVEYDSIWSLTLFVVSYFMVGFVIDLFVHPLTIIIGEKIQDKYSALFLQFAIEVSANWMILHALNAIMDSISITLITELIVAVFLFLVEYMLGNNESKKKSA